MAIAAALTVLGAAGLVLYAGGLAAVGHALAGLPWVAVALALVAVAVEWASDAARYAVLAGAVGVRAPARLWLKAALVNLFASYVANAGAPVTAYLLHRRGVNGGKAFALTLAKQALFLPAAILPACLLALWGPAPVPGSAWRATLGSALAFALGVVGLLALIATAPGTARRAILFATRGRGEKALGDFIDGVGLIFRGHPGRVAASFLLAVINEAALAGAAVALLYGLGASGGAGAWALSFIFSTISQSAPTPGGAGVSEVGGALLFHAVLPAPSVAAFLLAWRLLAIQLPIAVGGVLLATELRGRRPR